MKRNEEISHHHIVRGIILAGFTLLLFKLLLTYQIIFFIAPKMIPFIYFSFIVLFSLSVLLILRGTSKKNGSTCLCQGEHAISKSFTKNMFIYSLFIIPIISGFLFSNNVLGSTVAMKRQINYGSQVSIAVSQQKVAEKNPTSYKDSINNQASSFDLPEPLTKEEYSSLEKKILKTNHIKFSDSMYVPLMNLIGENLSQVVGKTITITGFVYKEPALPQDQFVIARFGVVCCIADATVYGMITKGNDIKLLNDEWIQVTGTIEKTTMEGADVPMIESQNITKIKEPSNPYVYDAGLKID
ncbi:TIGR03943 family putative permease subunit [Bacillus sp. 03113]|uniref:TIGR03943 family putative permease subunit n=1 Tax=Bacillus sp. 03113 TaxID=2578211 RepID=UPI00215C42E4|nr:TIGR03943 family protein [Bacillus sp. 03113]